MIFGTEKMPDGKSKSEQMIPDELIALWHPDSRGKNPKVVRANLLQFAITRPAIDCAVLCCAPLWWDALRVVCGRWSVVIPAPHRPVCCHSHLCSYPHAPVYRCVPDCLVAWLPGCQAGSACMCMLSSPLLPPQASVASQHINTTLCLCCWAPCQVALVVSPCHRSVCYQSSV